MTEQQTEQFDPADHNVDDVNAYLATADETERQRVLDAEAAGKGRSTVKAPEAAPEAPQADADDLTGPEGPIVGTDPVTGGPADQGHTTTEAPTFQEAAENATVASGEAYEKGYFGYAPSKDGPNPVDLSVAGVTGQNQDA